MLASATNFALGFFGWPLDEKLLLSVTVEADHVGTFYLWVWNDTE